MSPAHSVYHQIIVTRLVRALGNFVVERALGEVVAAPLDVQFNDTSVFQPDVLYIPGERFSIEAERSEIRPALVVEVLVLPQPKLEFSVIGVSGVCGIWDET